MICLEGVVSEKKVQLGDRENEKREKIIIKCLREERFIAVKNVDNKVSECKSE
jgi:hypothetical protein